jgi:glycosyltransferase involved in cell wall biosynthesis
MEVVVFAPYYPPAYRAGGPVKSISQLVRAPANPFPTLVVSRNWDLGARSRLRPEANTWLDTGEERVWAFDRGVGPYVRSLLAVARRKPGLVYVNSLFDTWTAAVPALAWRVGSSRRSIFVVAPRGQLGPQALAKSAYRKQVYLRFWRRLARHERVVVHAASEQERSDIERVFGKVEIVVRPNDVGPLLPPLASPEHGAELRAVFLGRVVPIKGLLEMLRSLRTVARPFSLDVYGPYEDERYLQLCREEAARLPSTARVSFMGPLASDAVRSCLVKYDVMLNPTRSESFGQAIGESLSVATPVAVADVTPWTAWIEQERGGSIVRDGEWAHVVESMSSLDAEASRVLRDGARRAYERWWYDAQGQPHLFQLVVAQSNS